MLVNVCHKFCQYLDICLSGSKTTGGVWTMRWLDPAFASIWTNCICMDYKHICHFVLILWTFVCLVFYFYRISQTSALWRWNPEFASFRTWVHFSYFTIWMNLELHLHYICICVWFLHRSKRWCITFRKCFLVAFFAAHLLYIGCIYIGNSFILAKNISQSAPS